MRELRIFTYSFQNPSYDRRVKEGLRSIAVFDNDETFILQHGKPNPVMEYKGHAFACQHLELLLIHNSVVIEPRTFEEWFRREQFLADPQRIALRMLEHLLEKKRLSFTEVKNLAKSVKKKDY